MRIALVVERFDEHGGGVERAVWRLAGSLRATGDDVHVIARTGVEQRGVCLHRVPVPTFWQPLRVWAFSRAAARRIAGNDFDVVHGFARTRVQDIFHAGGGSHAAYMRHRYSPFGARARQWSPRHRVQLQAERAIVRDPQQRIQCVSEMVRREFESLYGVPEHRLFVVPYGVDLEVFNAPRWQPDRDALRAEFGGAKGTVWLFPGSGFERKGLDTALAALARSADRSARLWVAGKDDPARWRRRARGLGIADRAHFLGRRNDIERIYVAADGVLLPTRYDAGALVCLEAAASRRPLVTSAQCGPSELLAEAGRVVARSDDVAGFAAALGHFSDARRREQAGARGREIAEAHSWDHCAAALRRAYVSVVERRKALRSPDSSGERRS